jgi:selenocysteine lyase/cysteine desulfurase
MRRLQQAGMPAIAAHERKLTTHTLRRLQTLEGLTVYGSPDPQRVEDRLGVISFDVQGVHHGKVAAILGFEGGIAVRNGRFCAHPYVLQLLDGDRKRQKVLQKHVLQGNWEQIPGLVRVSFGCYNDRDDVDHLVHMLEKIIAGEYAGDYAIDESSGDYWPRQFNKTLIEEAFTI